MALLMYRFPSFGLVGAAFPRYATKLQIGLLGVLWVIIYWTKTLPRHKAVTTWLIIVVATGGPYLLHLSSAIETAPFVRQAEAGSMSIVLAEQFEKKNEVCPNEQLCRNGVITLKDQRLNIYRTP